jgi:hypothetical protein
MKTSLLCISACLLRVSLFAAEPISAPPPPVRAPSLRNAPWPQALENAYLERAHHAIQAFSKPSSVNHTLETEKGTLPAVMFNYLAGHKEHALREMAGLDGEQGWTDGIDLYWCFTLKGQVRKYLLWGPELPQEYQDRFFRAAKLWSSEDPRPTMELVNALSDPDASVRAHALRLLQAMRATPPEKLAEQATNPEAKAALLAFAETDMAKEIPGEELEKWKAWWSFFSGKDWKVFEEVERVSNPRPHPTFGVGKGPVGATWNPETRGGWVDARNTDNLRAMRETSVYLLAEATGNEEVRKLYKQKIRRFVTDLYRVGMGEWDSETYIGHTTVPYITLYDFSKDPEVTALAKAALDWLAASQAWKFYDGGFAPPCKRDYAGTAKVWGPGATSLPALWFGSSHPHPSPHVDDVHAITSSYRPPLAVWHLANKNFRRPVEVLATKPAYQVFLPGGDDKPAYWETVYYGNHFYLGSTVCLGGDGDMSPFSLLAENPARGVDVVLAMPGLRHNLKVAGSQIGQHHNQVIYLARGGKEFSWQLPKSAERVSEGGVWFVRLHSTWLAFWPIGLQDWAPGTSPARTTDKAKDDILVAKAAPGNDLTGFALIAADTKDFADFNAFKAAILREASLTSTAKEQWTLKGPGGRTLAMTYNRENDLPIVLRDGVLRDYNVFDQWKPSEPNGPIESGWKDGKLTVRAGGWVFRATVDADGTYSFSEEKE